MGEDNVGTSSAYQGIKGTKPNSMIRSPFSLENESDFTVALEAAKGWTQTNRIAHKFINETSEHLEELFVRFIESMGGKRLILKAMIPGIDLLLDFLTALQTLKVIHGKLVMMYSSNTITAASVLDLLLQVSKLIPTAGGDKYASIRRTALISTLDALSRDYESHSNEKFTSHYDTSSITRRFVKEHLFKYTMNFLGYKFEEVNAKSKTPPSDSQTRQQRRRQILEYIDQAIPEKSFDQEVLNREVVIDLYNDALSYFHKSSKDDEE